jgi:hypothetical protein
LQLGLLEQGHRMATNDYLDLLEAGAPDGQLLGAIRLSTVNRVARLRVANETGLARVHILSNNGVELSSTMDLQIGQVVQLDLSEMVSTTATVTTKDCNRFALAFESRVNCAELLRQLVAEARADRGRPLRLAAGRISAKGRSTKGVHQLELDDISQRGMRVRHDGSLEAGLRVDIDLPNGRKCQGIVRWAQKSCAGLQLIDILSADDLGAVSRLGNASRDSLHGRG